MNAQRIYKLSIWYAATINGTPDVRMLTAYEVDSFIRPEVGFMHDMLTLEGKGVARLTLEVIPIDPA